MAAMVRCSLQVVHLAHAGLLAHPLHPCLLADPCLLASLATPMHSRMSSVWQCCTPDASPEACLMYPWYIDVSLIPRFLGGILSSSSAPACCKFSTLPAISLCLPRTKLKTLCHLSEIWVGSPVSRQQVGKWQVGAHQATVASSSRPKAVC